MHAVHTVHVRIKCGIRPIPGHVIHTQARLATIFFLISFAVLGLCCCGPSLAATSRGCSPLQCACFHCRGSSCCGPQALREQALLLRGTWDLPGSGIEPMSSAVAGEFLTTGRPRKPKFGYDFLNTTCP